MDAIRQTDPAEPEERRKKLQENQTAALLEGKKNY